MRMALLSNIDYPSNSPASEFLNRSSEDKVQIAALLADKLEEGSAFDAMERQLVFRASLLLGRQLNYSETVNALLEYVFANVSESNEKLIMMSVDQPFRDEIRGLTRKIRGIINQVEIDDNVRHLLIKRLNAFENDLDRTRTRADSFFRFFLDLTKTVGDGADNLKPAIERAEKVSGKIAGAVEAEETKQIEFKPTDDNECPF